MSWRKVQWQAGLLGLPLDEAVGKSPFRRNLCRRDVVVGLKGEAEHDGHGMDVHPLLQVPDAR